MADSKNLFDPIPESLRKSLETAQAIQNSIAPMVEQTRMLQSSLGPIMEQQVAIQSMTQTVLPALPAIVENSMAEAMQIAANNQVAMEISACALHAVKPSYAFESLALVNFANWNNNFAINIANELNTLLCNPIIQAIQPLTSYFGEWLQTIDFLALRNILDSIQTIGFDYDYKEVNDVFLKAMFDAKWFPYAGWIANFRIVDEMLDILDTSRASKNRVKRIDNLFFSYYNKDEINNLKRGWRQMNLPSYMKRILVQSIQAYHRREYALTVSALSTLWEGIIQEKVNDDSYRISRKTRENLAKLIEENEFDKIFSSFCDEFIFYNCTKPEEVKPDVPGRHGIAHCWYDTYPNRKVALNAILFTDFLLGLKPLDKTEENANG